MAVAIAILSVMLVTSLYLNFVQLKSALTPVKNEVDNSIFSQTMQTAVLLHNFVNVNIDEQEETSEDSLPSDKVAIHSGFAYWQDDNGELLQAPYDSDSEEIDFSNTHKVDVHSVDSEHLDLLMSILDALKGDG